MDQEVDNERYRAAMDRLNDIFKDISATANRVSTWRCPYKNAEGCCTARFGCRNQSGPGAQDGLPPCTGSDDLDYRNAWEV